MEEALQIQRFEAAPTAQEFASRIESNNIPAVFKGCIKDWKAFTLWNPSHGGLNYLRERAGSCTVEAMLSRSAPVFYGDLRRHERVPLPFSVFLDLCEQNLRGKIDHHDICSKLETEEVRKSDAENMQLLGADSPEQIYLAQVPIMNVEGEERVQLENLREDITTPSFLESKELASINLWMNNAPARSSSHYDPHHNVLCIVSGCKEVALWPPSASPFLYPMPLYGEASNHSSVALENPDISRYPRAEHLMDYSQRVTLHAGDALFIPEGWFHQVDSSDLTVAVNFWWRSCVMSIMSEHMDGYYFRRVLRRLIDNEMNKDLPRASSAGLLKLQRHTCELPANGNADIQDHVVDKECANRISDEPKQNPRSKLNELRPLDLQVLHELVSLVHNHVNFSNQGQVRQSPSTNEAASGVGGEVKNVTEAPITRSEDDIIAKILWNLNPHTFRNVLLAMVNNFPRTLEGLILHLLSPVGAEILTRKFDEMDLETTEENRNEFYLAFYGVFDDQSAAMDAILRGKEAFAHQAFKNVLDQFLGVNLNGINTTTK